MGLSILQGKICFGIYILFSFLRTLPGIGICLKKIMKTIEIKVAFLGPWIIGSWWTLSQFSRRAKRRIPEITGLFFSLQYPEKLWKDYSGRYSKVPERQLNLCSQPAQLHKTKILLVKPDFLLCQGNSPNWAKKTHRYNLFGPQQSSSQPLVFARCQNSAGILHSCPPAVTSSGPSSEVWEHSVILSPVIEQIRTYWK